MPAPTRAKQPGEDKPPSKRVGKPYKPKIKNKMNPSQATVGGKKKSNRPGLSVGNQGVVRANGQPIGQAQVGPDGKSAKAVALDGRVISVHDDANKAIDAIFQKYMKTFKTVVEQQVKQKGADSSSAGDLLKPSKPRPVQKSLDDLVIKFDEGQPRDAQGRFASVNSGEAQRAEAKLFERYGLEPPPEDLQPPISRKHFLESAVTSAGRYGAANVFGTPQVEPSAKVQPSGDNGLYAEKDIAGHVGEQVKAVGYFGPLGPRDTLANWISYPETASDPNRQIAVGTLTTGEKGMAQSGQTYVVVDDKANEHNIRPERLREFYVQPEKVKKFNPYHDEHGLFASAEGQVMGTGGFTIQPVFPRKPQDGLRSLDLPREGKDSCGGIVPK